MSCSFWNMRRRLRKQLGIERAIEENKVVVDIAKAQKQAKETEGKVFGEEPVTEVKPKTVKKTTKKAVKSDDNT